MNKNNIIGFTLIAVVLIAFSWFNQPSAEQLEAQARQDSINTALQQKAEQERLTAEQNRKAEAEAAAHGDTTSIFHNALNGEAKPVVLKNQKLELTLSTKGGTLSKAVIKDFTGHHKNAEGKYDQQLDTKDLTLFEGEEQCLNFLLAGKTDNIITKDMFFTPSNQTDSTVTIPGEQLLLYSLAQVSLPGYSLFVFLNLSYFSKKNERERCTVSQAPGF